MHFSTTAQHAGIAALALLTVGVAAFALRPAEVTAVPDRTAALSFGEDGAAAEAVAQLGPVGASLAEQIDAAVGATEWPDLEPSMDDAIKGPQAPADVYPCGAVSRPAASACTWGSPTATKTMMVLGDSVAMTYVGPLKTFAENSGGQWKVRSEAMFGCAFVDRNTAAGTEDEAIATACPNRKTEAIRAVNEVRPDIVVIVNLASGGNQDDWYASLKRLTDQFAPNVGKIVLMSAPPTDIKIGDCYNRINKPADCISRVTGAWYERSSVEKSLATSLNGTYIDTRRWFCTPDDYCPSFVGNTPMKRDYSHITPEYGAMIAPAVAETLTAAGL